MLRGLRDLEKYSVSATDGDIGKVVNFLLDDHRWVVRYLVVETGGFLGDRRVLISPIAFREADWSTQRFHVAITVDMVKHSPSVDTDQPVSAQHEREHFRYYGYSPYWADSGLWGPGRFPGTLQGGTPSVPPAPHSTPPRGDSRLRSANEVRGYHVLGNEEPVGHIEDFVLDDSTWAVQYLVIDTSNWWFGKKVLISPTWARGISYEDRRVYVDMSRQMIEDSPEWDMSAAVNREYETRLYDYYGRPVYWASDRPELAPKREASPPRL